MKIPRNAASAFEDLERQERQTLAATSTIRVWDAFTPVLAALVAVMPAEFVRARAAAKALAEAEATLTADPDAHEQFGEALFHFCRAWQRLMRLEAVFKAETATMLELFPALGRSEATKAAELAREDGLPVPEIV
jgi:hypothetical protein